MQLASHDHDFCVCPALRDWPRFSSTTGVLLLLAILSQVCLGNEARLFAAFNAYPGKTARKATVQDTALNIVTDPPPLWGPLSAVCWPLRLLLALDRRRGNSLSSLSILEFFYAGLERLVVFVIDRRVSRFPLFPLLVFRVEVRIMCSTRYDFTHTTSSWLRHVSMYDSTAATQYLL